MTGDDIASLEPALRALLEGFRDCFRCQKTFGHWQTYIVGLLSDLKRKSIEPIALASGVAVRTLQEFLAFFVWDDERVNRKLQHQVADARPSRNAIGVVDASAHGKRGDKTPGVSRQWCGESGKVDNCVVGQHLLYTDNHPTNPFSCVLASDLYLPKSWDEDRQRCLEAGIPDHVRYRPKWLIALDQIREAIGNGIRFSWITFDEDYGQIPRFWFELDALGQRGIGEVRPNFRCWVKPPACRSGRTEHAARRVDNVCRYSPTFTQKPWHRIKIKNTTRGPSWWEIKAARVRLVNASNPDNNISVPTDRKYWLIVARNPATREVKYFVSNASAHATLKEMMRVAFTRWHIEKWFERAKQEAAFGAFEVRTYRSLIRHWLSSRMAMYFLADQTQRLREKKSVDHAGTGRRRGQHPGIENMEPLVSVLG